MYLNILMLLLAATLVGVGAARRRRRKANWNKFVSGTLEIDLAMTTLAAKTLTSQSTETVVDTARVSSVKIAASITGFTPADGVGPFLFGVAHSDYTNSEIEAYIEQAGSWDRGDLGTREVRSRRIKILGQLGQVGSGIQNIVYNDGKLKSCKLNWVLTEGDGLDFWVYNMGDAAVATTVPQFVVNGNANIWYD